MYLLPTCTLWLALALSAADAAAAPRLIVGIWQQEVTIGGGGGGRLTIQLMGMASQWTQGGREK